MTESPRSCVDGKRTAFWTRRKRLVAVVALVFVTAAILALLQLGGRSKEFKRQPGTPLLFLKFATTVKPGLVFFPPPLADGHGDDPTGQGALRAKYQQFRSPTVVLEGTQLDVDAQQVWLKFLAALDKGEPSLDPWNHPIYYRCPGPIHKHGWDMISCGPNGVFEEGDGDDIVFGEDLPPGEVFRWALLGR